MTMHLIRQVFTQEMHCCGDADKHTPELTLVLHDGGGGEYLVIHAAHWAVDSEAEIAEVATAMKKMFASGRKGVTK
jgi:hypothetical protein